MGKISPVSAKYIVHSSIDIDGVVDRPDVIGAVFGQTEGLLGADLELRELQRSGRIGRIEVNVDTRSGKTKGTIIVPSSLDKAETCIVAAALEIIQRIGPCNARIKVINIEDVRITKRSFVIERAKDLLKNLMDKVMPDSQELADEVAYSVRVMEIQEYGKERLPAGPAIDESDEIIVVEGRADVINLLKHGIKNAIAINGTSVPATMKELSRKKVITAFMDGDRGGDLILKELTTVAEIDYVTKAPEGKEVEEITKKEIHKALRNRVSVEQIKMDMGDKDIGRQHDAAIEEAKRISNAPEKPRVEKERERELVPQPPQHVPSPSSPSAAPRLSDDQKKRFREMLEDLVGTRGAYILDDKLNILGKVPFTELTTTLKSLTSGIYAIVFDGIIDRTLIMTAEKVGVSYLVGMEAKVRTSQTKMAILTINEL